MLKKNLLACQFEIAIHDVIIYHVNNTKKLFLCNDQQFMTISNVLYLFVRCFFDVENMSIFFIINNMSK